MEPLITLIVVTLALLGAGAAGVIRLRPWSVALRGGLSAMFVLTGVVHFVGMRAELISMVPPALPNPDLLVTISGILELAGAVGLLWQPTTPWAAGGLTLMLVIMFPANIYAALEGHITSPADALVPRTLIQLVFLSATLTILVSHMRRQSILQQANAPDNSQS